MWPARLIVVAFVIGLASAAAAQTYLEAGGIVVIEVESQAAVPDWLKETSVTGYTGSGYHRWNGPDLFNTPGQGVLTYAIQISSPGNYTLAMRNHHDHPDSTLENDCYTRMDGGAWVKTYSSTANTWTWHTRHEVGTQHLVPVYTLAAGLHTFTISGRSKNFRIDRFHLYKASVANPLDQTRPPSQTAAGPPPGAATITGELRAWHRVTLTFDGPQASEGGSPNPFTDYRLNVTFSRAGKSYTVPGFFAADGNAAETSATSGTKWRVHFAPEAAGTWTYAASFRSGPDVAINASATAGTATSFDGATGTFSVAATNKSGRDHRGKGRLAYTGGHYLRFAGSGEYFIKGGADSPENFLAYGDFDATTAKHAYAPHASDYKAGDPTWKGGKGKAIVGALNYLSGKGMNSVYFLTMNVNGDGNDVWPWTAATERERFDVSKLDQWEIVFAQMDKLGLALHVVTQETENDQLLDGGALGRQRKLYYRELIARFAHHLAVFWNLGEENTNTDAQRKAFGTFFNDTDPYDHPVVLHTFPGQYSAVYTPLLGHAGLEGPSLQMGDMAQTHSETINWIDKSAGAGRKWVVCLDEIGPANTGVATDTNDPAHDGVRRHALWGNLMAGGGGVEWYFGYAQPHDDLDCEDWRSRDKMWDLTRHALTFFQQHLPFSQMKHADALSSRSDDYVFAKAGEVYAVYLPTAMATTLVLSGDYTVKWYDPRAGGALVDGTVKTLTGTGAAIDIGLPPKDTGKDWVALLRHQGVVPPTPDGGVDAATVPDSAPQLAVTSLTLIDADTDQPIVTFDPLLDGDTLNLAFLPSKNLNLRANVSGSVGSVVFTFDGNANYRTESAAPFALEGDTAGDYAAGVWALGKHTVTATPFEGTGGSGAQGKALTIAFDLIDDVNAPDRGIPDLGLLDRGVPDAPSLPGDAATTRDGPSGDGAAPAGDGPPASLSSGCGCGVSADATSGALLFLFFALALAWRCRPRGR